MSRNVRDSPGSGAPVPCPARNLLLADMSWKFYSTGLTNNYNLPITLVKSITFEIIVTRDKFALASLGVPIV